MKRIIITLSGLIVLGISHLSAESNWPTWRGPSGQGVADGAPPIEWGNEKNIKWKVAIPGRGMSTPIVWGNKVFMLTAVPTGPKKESPVGASQGRTPSGASARAPSGNRGGSGGGFNREEFMKRFDKNKDGQLSESERAAIRSSFGGSNGASKGGRRSRGGRGGFSMSQAPTQAQKFTVMALDRKTGKTLWEQTAHQEFPHEGHHRDHGFASSSPVTVRVAPVLVTLPAMLATSTENTAPASLVVALFSV